jgi:hypothetical protein
MWKRLLVRTALLGLVLLLPAAAPAADDRTGKPPLIMSLASYDKLRSDFFYLANVAGKVENAAQVEALIEVMAGDNRLAGIDRKKPAGAYGWIGFRPADSAIVVLIPIADQAAFLGLLDHLGIAARRGGDGVYSANVEQIPDPVYFRFADGYVYATTRDKGVLADGRLLAPSDVLTGQDCAASAGADKKPSGGDYWSQRAPADPLCRNVETNVFLLSFYYDRISEELKERILADFDLQMALAKTREAPRIETEWERRARRLTIDEIAGAVKTLIREGGETSVRLDLDRRAGDMALTYWAKARTGTALAAAIQDLGQIRSTTAGLLGKDAAVNGTFYGRLPEKLREAFLAAIDDDRQKAVTDAKDQSKRAALNAFFDALLPTVRAGELDWTFRMQGPGRGGLYTVVGGLKLKNGARLERVLLDAAKVDPPPAELRLGVEKMGSVGIHLLEPKLNEDARRALGDGPAYFAFRDDAMLIAAGANALDAIKDALAVAPVMGKVLDAQIAVSRLAPLAKNEQAGEIARRVFGDDRDGDRIRVTMEGGKAMTLQLAMKTKLIDYFSRIIQAANAGR